MNVLKIPFSSGGLGKTKGTEKAPDKVLEGLDKDSLNEKGILPLIEVKEVKINQSNIEETNKNITNAVKKETGKALLLGGDHSITYSAFKGLLKKENPGIVIFDAHPDCVNNFSPPTHEDFVRVLIEEGIVKKDNIILIGLRKWHKSEYAFLKKNKIRYFTARDLCEDLSNMTETIMDNARSFSDLYLSIDIDVVDPAFAPGTGYPEAGGLTSRQLIYMLQRIAHMKNLKITDLVEINPDKDQRNMTCALGSKIIKELC